MSVRWAPTKGPKSKRLAEERLRFLLYHATGDDNTFLERARREIPEAWMTLELDLETHEPKEKVTLYLDKSVVKMFRAMGHGYQARINRVLETYLQLKISENIAFEMDALEAIRKAAKDRRLNEEAPDVAERRSSLYEHWAYEQGVMDSLIQRPEDGKAGGG